MKPDYHNVSNFNSEKGFVQVCYSNHESLPHILIEKREDGEPISTPYQNIHEAVRKYRAIAFELGLDRKTCFNYPKPY
jgi:hypothetical protein